MLYVARVYMVHFPSVTQYKRKSVHENILLFLKYLAWVILDLILVSRKRKEGNIYIYIYIYDCFAWCICRVLDC